MAVYTHVEVHEVAEFLGRFDLGDFRSYEGITQGVENTNYHLHTETGRYILTIFEKRIRREDLPFVFGFTAHLKNAGLNVPDAYPDKSGQIIGTLAGKPAAIIRFLEGAGVPDADITPNHCAELGATLARMHLAVAGFGGVRHNPVDLTVWKKLLGDAMPNTDLLSEDDRKSVDTALKEYELLDMQALPRGAVHADAFPDNVFFKGEKLTGVIDFYFGCTDAFVYDVAMTLNAWCFKTDGTIVPERLKAFTEAYESLRPLNTDERASFGILRRAAALRILSTRLYDWVFTPADAKVIKKDPLEYARKLRADITWP